MNPTNAKSPAVRLLIVDHDVSEMKALCDALRVHGYETSGFNSAKAALAALRESKFDLLLFDLRMPEQEGLSFWRSALEIDSSLVGIIMRGQGTVETVVDLMKSDSIDFIVKPFEISAILPVFSRALLLRRLRVENAELQRCLQQRAGDLDRANQELDSFTHSVSHDLRAPLRAIGGFSNILLKDFAPQLPDEARRVVNIIVSSAVQISQMIDGLLDLSRIGRQSLSIETLDLAPLITEALNDLCRDVQRHRVELKICDLPRCRGDATLLKQVLANLLSNAFKFSAHTKNPIIEIGVRPGNREHTYFIRDNGIGFDMQYAQRLFGVFGRLHPEEEFEGHGLGLALAQRIIQRHGGRIWSEAEVNKGATFFFTLPAAT